MSTPSLLNIPYLYKAGTLYSQIPESGAGDFTVTRTTSVANRSTRINKDGFIETVLDNVPRLDYPLGGAVNGCPALLVEPAATNGIRNNSMVGASAPNNLPTNWGNQLSGGITQTIVGTGTENGVSYIDIRFSGTQTNTTPTDIRFESATQIVASNTQVWTESAWLKIVAAPNPPTDYRLYMFERDSGGGFIKFVSQVAAVTTTLTRFTFTRALDGGASVARVQPALTFTTSSGSTYDFTIRIGYPQMELGSVATSVIPTTTAAVTRNADVVSKTGVSSLIGQTEGTIYMEVDIRNMAKETYLIRIDEGATSNILSLRTLTSNVVRTAITAPTPPATTNISSAVFTAGIVKIAFAYKSGEIALSVNGATALTANGTFAFGASLNRITLGSNASPSSEFNDRIRDFEIHPNRLTNAELATLTAL